MGRHNASLPYFDFRIRSPVTASVDGLDVEERNERFEIGSIDEIGDRCFRDFRRSEYWRSKRVTLDD